MTAIPTLEDALANHPLCQRVQGMLFSHLVHQPTQLHIHIGFRCLSAPLQTLTAALEQRRWEDLLALPPSHGPDGTPCLSAVRLDIAYLLDDAVLAVQPMTVVHHRPTPVSAACFLTPSESLRWSEALRALDQTQPRAV